MDLRDKDRRLRYSAEKRVPYCTVPFPQVVVEVLVAVAPQKEAGTRALLPAACCRVTAGAGARAEGGCEMMQAFYSSQFKAHLNLNGRTEICCVEKRLAVIT